MRFMLKFIIPITARLKLSENDLITPITYPKGFTTTPRMCHLRSLPWDDQRQKESSDCVSQSRAEDEDICQRSPRRENDTPNGDQRYQSVYLELQGNSHFSGTFSFWDNGLALLLFNIYSPSHYNVKHCSPNLLLRKRKTQRPLTHLDHSPV